MNWNFENRPYKNDNANNKNNKNNAANNSKNKSIKINQVINHFKIRFY